MRAMSVLGTTKSNRYRKTHQVELGGAGRKFLHLTRGDLPRESGEVSRGRSSEEAVETRMERRAEEPRDRPFKTSPGNGDSMPKRANVELGSHWLGDCVGLVDSNRKRGNRMQAVTWAED